MSAQMWSTNLPPSLATVPVGPYLVKSLPDAPQRRTPGKRIFDVVFATLAVLMLLPVFFLIALLIKLTDSGPVLFWQERVGLHGKRFLLPKFRSMVPEAETLKSRMLHQNHHGEGVTFKMKRDPRVTPVGRFLRRFSLDELPQLWCVLKGEMSLVGPRPAVPHEVARYSKRERARLNTLPGMTCIWQVSGRADLPFEQQVELDKLYIQRQGLFTDLVLLALTVPAVLSGRGAY